MSFVQVLIILIKFLSLIPLFWNCFLLLASCNAWMCCKFTNFFFLLFSFFFIIFMSPFVMYLFFTFSYVSVSLRKAICLKLCKLMFFILFISSSFTFLRIISITSSSASLNFSCSKNKGKSYLLSAFLAFESSRAAKEVWDTGIHILSIPLLFQKLCLRKMSHEENDGLPWLETDLFWAKTQELSSLAPLCHWALQFLEILESTSMNFSLGWKNI